MGSRDVFLTSIKENMGSATLSSSSGLEILWIGLEILEPSCYQLEDESITKKEGNQRLGARAHVFCTQESAVLDLL